MTTTENKESVKKTNNQAIPRTSVPSTAVVSQTSPTMVTQKTNNVSTVLLYGIPIVSLYIEGQERLCLAQISNTLLKTYSYNEIHNRRVALGITCVQCTPVQLEILRRAGAMPVSSRRCGMITRREAERLCKSFLGDNSPPRLPEDFAFNVQHKCAWGCRGAFLPSRYNSSRAKCIKCAFCGIFFSPNKFIFHSHRMSASDKYVQPDAANFNSWRRHMFLGGQPQEEIIHAWEDVKAMFNGGTRKRLLHSGAMSGSMNTDSSTTIDVHVNLAKEDSLVPVKRIRKINSFQNNCLEEESKKSNSSNAKISNESINVKRSALIVPQCFKQLQSDTVSPLQISGFTPQLMADYMFQTHQQNQKVNNSKNAYNCSPFSFQNCNPTSWLKTPPTSSSLKYLGTSELRTNTTTSTSSFLPPNNYSIPSLLCTSAFKPVIQQNLQREKPTINTVTAAATFVSSSMYTCNTNTTPQSSHTPCTPNSLAFTSLSPNSRSTFPTSILVRSQTFPALSLQKYQSFPYDDENATDQSLQQTATNEDDDEIEVDIETTEDDTQQQDFKSRKLSFSEHIKINNSQNDNSIEMDTATRRESSQKLSLIYKSRSCTELNSSEANNKQIRCSPRSHQCSCSSSNDSLYMSAPTKSEKECSSRATSTTSAEIQSDETSNVKPLLQNTYTPTPTLKEITQKREGPSSFLKEFGSVKAQNESTDMFLTEFSIKRQKSALIKSNDGGAAEEVTTDSTNISNNAVTLLEAFNSNSKSHVMTNISNHNKFCNTYNHDLWQVASLCLHRPQLMHNSCNSEHYSNHYSSV